MEFDYGDPMDFPGNKKIFDFGKMSDDDDKRFIREIIGPCSCGESVYTWMRWRRPQGGKPPIREHFFLQ